MYLFRDRRIGFRQDFTIEEDFFEKYRERKDFMKDLGVSTGVESMR